MNRISFLITSILICLSTAHCQTDNEIFRGTFFSDFFGFKMQSLTTTSNTYSTTIYYLGKELDKPRNYELYGQLSRELHGVEFKYKLIEKKVPKNLELIKNYYSHTMNNNNYKHLFDTISGDWINDSLDVLDSLISHDIQTSENIKSNEIGVYYNSKKNKYYIKTTNYCTLVRIKTTSKLKGKRFMKKYGYKIDSRDMCLSLMSSIQYCDFIEQSDRLEFGLDINCYELYPF